MVVIGQKSLIDGIKLHDENTFQELFRIYTKLLWAVAGSILSACNGSEQDIEECVSDVFIELWNHPGKFDPARGSLKSYLCRIAKNNAIDTYRKKSKENVVQLEDYIEKVAEDDLIDIPDYSQLYEEIKNLQEPTREIMVRRYFHNEKPAKIADRLGLPKKEVENRLYRGKKTLSTSLSEYREVK